MLKLDLAGQQPLNSVTW